MTLLETQRLIQKDPEHWYVPLMDFVDDFRRAPNLSSVAEQLDQTHECMDALLVSVAETLCDEAGIDPPVWMEAISACKDPWFVSGFESLKAIAIVESPIRFRIRKIFVLENFLSRA